MKALLDFFPVIAFFVVYIFFGRDIYLATQVIMATMVLQIGILWVMHRTVSRMHLVSAALVLVFGGLTLLLRNDLFIKWKPTVVNWLFAVFFLGSQYLTEKPIVQRMMEGNVELEARAWRQLNTMWIVFFSFLGALNLFVVYNFSEPAWVKFKLFGLIGLTVLFSVAQGFWLMRKIPDEKQA